MMLWYIQNLYMDAANLPGSMNDRTVYLDY